MASPIQNKIAPYIGEIHILTCSTKSVHAARKSARKFIWTLMTSCTLVHEWLGKHRQQYMCFLQRNISRELDPDDYILQPMCHRILKPGFYQGHIGDAMPLGMSNVLNTPIVILTSNKDNPILYTNTVGVINSTCSRSVD